MSYTYEEIEALKKNELNSDDNVKVIVDAVTHSFNYESSQKINPMLYDFILVSWFGAVGEVICHNENGSLKVRFDPKNVRTQLVLKEGAMLIADFMPDCLEKV